MTRDRLAKILTAVLAITVVSGLCGWWARTHARVDAEATHTTADAASAHASLGASPALVASAHVAAPSASQGAVASIDDARCTVQPPPSPTQRDASDDATPDAATSAPAPDARAQASRAQLLARLRASADPYANAVAVWLDVDGDGAANHRADRLRQLGARGDPSGLQEALFHVTQSTHLAERKDAPLQPIIDAAADDADSLVAAQSLSVDAIGIAAAQVAPIGYTMCGRATPADANVWQQCVAMSDLLAHRSDSLQARMMGASIEKKLTGDATASERAAAQFRRMLALDIASSSGCGDLRAKLALMRRLAVDGDAALPSR